MKCIHSYVPVRATDMACAGNLVMMNLGRGMKPNDPIQNSLQANMWPFVFDRQVLLPTYSSRSPVIRARTPADDQRLCID